MFASRSAICRFRGAAQKGLSDVSHRHRPFLNSSLLYASSSAPLQPLQTTTSRTVHTRPDNLSNSPVQPLKYDKMSNNETFQLGEVFNVKDKVALVTGGGSGIGLMATQALAVNGAKVYIVGRTEEKLDRVAEVYGKGIAGQIIPIVGDVSTKEGVQAIVKEIESREKCLCILINNAGIAPDKTETSHDTPEEMRENLLGPTSVEEWTSVYTTNVVGPFMLTTGFLPLLQRATETHHGYSGCVINITSISGLVKISQGHFSYNASKGAQIQLNKMLSAEIAKMGFKIRVNGIAPGVFPSEMTTQDSDDKQKSHMPKEKKEMLPSQRPGHDRDMAAAILFAASCQYLNGQNIPVDGGYLIQVGQ